MIFGKQTVIHYDGSGDEAPRTLVADFDRIVDQYYVYTEVGPMQIATLFPTYLHAKLLVHHNNVVAAKQLLADVKGEIYTFANEASRWRNQ